MNAGIFGKKGLSWERLRSFRAVAEAGAIVKAAGADAVRQSLMSRQIRELEALFEVKLVVRKGRGLALTDAGRTLAGIIRNQMQTLQEFDDVCHQRAESFSLAGSNTLLLALFLPRLGAIRKALPQVSWELRHLPTRDTARAVAEGAIDFALLRAAAVPAGVQKIALGQVEWVLVLPREGSLAQRGNAVGSLDGLPLALPVGGDLREAVDDYAVKRKVALNVALACNSYQQALQAVVAGSCAAILPDLALRAIPLPLRVLPLPDSLRRRQSIVLAWRKRLMDIRLQRVTARDLLARELKFQTAAG